MVKLKASLVAGVLAVGIAVGIAGPAPAPVRAATLDVTDFGANGQDTLDDTQAIQDALDGAAPGDTVFIPDGSYSISDTLRPTVSGITIQGESQAGTVIAYHGTTSKALIHLSALEDITINHLTLEGEHSALISDGIRAEHGSGHQINDVTIQNIGSNTAFGPHAIYFTNSPGAKITNNTISNIGVGDMWGAGMRIAFGSDEALIEGNTIADTGRGGIFANNGCSDLIIRDNKITGSGLHSYGLSIELHTDCDRALVEDNDVDHWISLVRSDTVAVRRNTVSANDGSVKGYGLEIMSSNAVVTENLVDGGQRIGISVSEYSNGRYQYFGHNTIQNMIQWGVQLQGGLNPISHMYFYKNTFKGTQYNHPDALYPAHSGHGFRIHGGTSYTTLDSNEIIGNEKLGLEITGGAGVDQLSVVNNHISNNGSASINQYPATALDLEWAGNIVTGNVTDTQLTSRGFSNQKPTANFTYTLHAEVGEAVQFTNTSVDSDGTIDHVLWDFGDGLPSTQLNPSYTYNEAGVYTVALLVWDEEGRADLQEQQVLVSTAAGGS
ncbi:right-handed parallel beta-helix repeat-containing protein [Paenibacillus daejeonensis]|uniref:right-handed parallel beta-helix repeat-containing protein n=1 Tax=Paenibacillus daejeonensis TaxID=135193 RepID=UPI00035F099E|nr:right-handed parallel beta-helix repeat-containing protein [Paenibacillus daejeonensis]